MSYTAEQERYLEDQLANYLAAFYEGDTECCRQIILRLKEEGYEKAAKDLYAMAAELIPY